jgi:DNA-binding NarL/FixJ family response regulator
MSGVCASRAPHSSASEIVRSARKRSWYKPRQAVIPPVKADPRKFCANAAPKHLSEIRDLMKGRASEPVTIVLADDHAIVRRGARTLLESDPGFRVVGEASDGAETLRLVEALTPEIVVLDISLPDQNGLDVTRKLLREAPNVKVIIFTMHCAEEIERQCLQAGACAYVLKSDDDDRLLDALRAVCDDRPFFTPRITHIFATYTGMLPSNRMRRSAVTAKSCSNASRSVKARL